MADELFAMQTEIDLPGVEGRLTVHDDVYDDSTDVWAEQAAVGRKYTNVRFVPAGPCEFCILGFDTAGLRKLATFLIDAADEIERAADRQTPIDD